MIGLDFGFEFGLWLDFSLGAASLGDWGLGVGCFE